MPMSPSSNALIRHRLAVFLGILLLVISVSGWACLSPIYRKNLYLFAVGAASGRNTNADSDEISSSLSASSGDEDDDDNGEDGGIKPKPEWSVSYIGGDPCGSKYNDNPFDAQGTKPGLPDDMKARIQAMADKRIQESEEDAANKKQGDNC
eukprot:CAMPEP_0195527926 /NCGR_PEP_ID=MMETSP0794_2-20130614/29866_1 /TAXON_ID=515487 /ORGANISM="Stephanopyxis turris, Strain CCMP 815" /LENGTH=150 /DNA_ID=CAMNT_0040658947 /DNA_START=25 /DNA_END=477 /DNA_ORIENTATION=-